MHLIVGCLHQRSLNWAIPQQTGHHLQGEITSHWREHSTTIGTKNHQILNLWEDGTISEWAHQCHKLGQKSIVFLLGGNQCFVQWI